MDNVIDFDSTLTAQVTFKKVMDAFAHPFKVYNINDSAENNPLIQGEYAPIQELCRVFLDNTVTFYVHADEHLAAGIKELTYARLTRLEDASFVVIKDNDKFGLWDMVCQGSLTDPHKGATVIVAVPQITGDIGITAEGPGINGCQRFGVDGSVAECVYRAAELNMEYPKGFEFIFVSRQGDICAVPRHIHCRKGAF